VKTSIGEWESPEERLEHAPRPRRRERPERSAREAPAEKPSGVSEGAPSGDGEDKKNQAAEGNVKLFVNRGNRSGIAEEDLRWALREGAVVPDDDVASVRVLERFSFVELKADQAERAVEFLDGTKLKGKEIRLEIAKK
jgi:ATP-dependent RNA helicase DeaD